MSDSDGHNEAAQLAQAVLHKVSVFLRNLSPEEMDRLAHGQVNIALVGAARSKRSRPAKWTGDDVSDVLSRLRDSTTSEDAQRNLQEIAPTRALLIQIAHALDVPSPKTDTVDRIRDRIVDATIGYRLRSEAIRRSPQDDA